MANEKLASFLLGQCKERGLSFRRLSINSGLSPGTVHTMLKRKYQPTLSSLNRLADYLGVRRQYLWQLAGLVEDDAKTTFGDPQLRSLFAEADKLPVATRNLVAGVTAAILSQLKEKNA